jgi:acetyl esterase/lipase
MTRVPQLPSVLSITKTCVYKITKDTDTNTKLLIDYYLPEHQDDRCSIMLYIHGGGFKVNSENFVVIGASAGAHLALLIVR